LRKNSAMQDYVNSAIKQFAYYRLIAETATERLSDEDFFKRSDPEANSVAIIMHHMGGNMISRWTHFLTEDGEKPNRDRDAEFENEISRDEVLKIWKNGWLILFETLESLTEDDLDKIIYIRNEGHTAVSAINRQLMHYGYHIGQIVTLSRQWVGPEWKSLSIAKNNSQGFNQEKFGQEKGIRHFTDGLVPKK
jgi:Protein of unknown function (DUF1572)